MESFSLAKTPPPGEPVAAKSVMKSQHVRIHEDTWQTFKVIAAENGVNLSAALETFIEATAKYRNEPEKIGHAVHKGFRLLKGKAPGYRLSKDDL